MGDQVQRRVSGPVLIERGQKIPDNAVPMTDHEVMRIQENRIRKFEPRSEVRSLLYSTHIMSAVAGMSGIMINTIVRKNFRLGQLRRMFTFLPTVVLPSIFMVGAHELDIKESILVGKETCPVCTTLRAAAWQASFGVAYPCLTAILSCLPTSREYYTLPMPKAEKGLGYVRLLRQVAPHPSVLAALALVNMTVASLLTHKEMKTYIKYFSQSPGLSQESDGELMRE